MKNKHPQNNQQQPKNTNDSRKGFIEPRPDQGSQRNKSDGLDKEDAGGTGREQRKDHGDKDRKIRNQ